MIDPNAPFVTYTDKYVSFRLLDYFGVEPNPFTLDYSVSPKKKRQQGREGMTLRILLPSETNAEFVSSTRSQMSQPMGDEWAGIHQRTTRHGPAALRYEAIEHVLGSENVATHAKRYAWQLLFPIPPADLHIVIHGEGEFSADEPIWREVIESIELHSTDFIPPKPAKPSPRRIKGKRVTARQRKLKVALESLPGALKYLAPVALDLSDQDMEDIKCGDGDLTAFDETIAKATAGLARPDALAMVARHRKTLHDWLEQHEDREASYLLPLHGLEGSLTGYLMHSGPMPDEDILRLAGIIAD